MNDIRNTKLSESDKTIGEIYDEMTDEQRLVVEAIVGYAVSEAVGMEFEIPNDEKKET